MLPHGASWRRQVNGGVPIIKLPKDKVIITVAQTGALVDKKMNPNVPEQPEEIIASAVECCNEGAAVVHIHARDESGSKSCGDMSSTLP